MPLDRWTAKEKQFYTDYYAPLCGCEITKVEVGVEDGQCWPSFRAVAKDGTVYHLELSQDPEGNGPGFLFGLPHPNQKD